MANELNCQVRLLDADLAQTEAGVTRAQVRRQSDVWTLLAAAVRPQARQGSGGSGGAVDSAERGEAAGGQLVLDLTEEDAVLEENRRLRLAFQGEDDG